MILSESIKYNVNEIAYFPTQEINLLSNTYNRSYN